MCWRRSRVAGGVVLGLVVLACGAAVRAEVIYSGTADGAWQNGAGGNRLAQTFRTGASPMTLDSVGVWIRNAGPNGGNSTSAPGTVTLSLFATDGSRKPTGSAVLTIVNNQSIDAWGDGWVTGTSLNYALAANTDYAVVFAASAGSQISWKYNNSTAITSSIAPTPTFSNWQSGDGGGTWSDAAPTTGFNMVVQATAVPEPPAAVLCAIGGLGALFFVRRRRQE